jgi:hypothetical protein
LAPQLKVLHRQGVNIEFFPQQTDVLVDRVGDVEPDQSTWLGAQLVDLAQLGFVERAELSAGEANKGDVVGAAGHRPGVYAVGSKRHAASAYPWEMSAPRRASPPFATQVTNGDSGVAPRVDLARICRPV